MNKKSKTIGLLAGVMATASVLGAAQSPPPPAASPAPRSKAKPDYPPHTEVMKGYEQVISSIDKTRSLLGIFVNRKENQMLAAFPGKYKSKKFFIALTVASGERYAGLQAGEHYVYWKQIGKRMVLIEPNVAVRSTGEAESQASVKRLFTDRVIADVPIKTMLPGWGPVIDMDDFLLGGASNFFGYSASGTKKHLATIKTAKAFPLNVELAFEVPVRNGILKTFHYSISEVAVNRAYRPRRADERVGFFTTSYTDLGKYQAKDSQVRYINRWHLEKADPKLKVSPVKNPLIFYIEHTTPIRYRRFVRDGVLMWNRAFSNIGLDNAIEVRYQDAATKAHMEKDPEDVRYNFVRWLNNNVGTAIGPSRVNPITGEILDADIILTDGWIRHYWRQFNELLPELAMEGFAPETLAWLKKRPKWDPRIRLAHPSQRDAIAAELASAGPQHFGGHALANVDPALIGDNEYDGLVGRTSQINGLCRAAECKALDMAMMRFQFELARAQLDREAKDGDENGDGEEAESKPNEDVLDGVPDWFIGPAIAELVAHEVGHTIGLRHNFKSSSIYSMSDINSSELKGKKPFAGSVMDYLPINMTQAGFGETQGDYTMIDIGPYDMWAVEYGYTAAKRAEDLKPILERVADPQLAYATDEDTYGPDPLARRYDFGADPITYAKSQVKLATFHRDRLIEEFVKDGESWAKTRYGYEMTLSVQSRAVSMMANWLGGAFIHRDKKGDPNGRPPIEVVPANQQRDALKFVIDHAFKDEAYGLDPELLQRMSVDKWLDDFSYSMQNATWPVHDRIMGLQSSVLSMVMNPTVLGRVYDNEFLTPAEQDMITLPEIFQTLNAAIWTEINQPDDRRFTTRQPMISSLRRNLQREYLERLIDLSLPDTWGGVSHKPLSNLAMMQLRRLTGQFNDVLTDGLTLDPYSEAHLSEAKLRIDKALDADYIYNTQQGGGMGLPFFIFGHEAGPKN